MDPTKFDKRCMEIYKKDVMTMVKLIPSRDIDDPILESD